MTVRDLTVQTQVTATADTVSTGFKPGIVFIELRRLPFENVHINNVRHAAVHFTRTSRTTGRTIRADNVGNYDHGSPDPVDVQPCVYMYASHGFTSKDNTFEDIVCSRVGAHGMRLRADEMVARGYPFGEEWYAFGGTNNYVSQTFHHDRNRQSIRRWLLAEGCGQLQPHRNIDIQIQGTTTGEPDETNIITGYTFGDFESFDSADLGYDCTYVRFERTSTDDIDMTTAPRPLQHYRAVSWIGR